MHPHNNSAGQFILKNLDSDISDDFPEISETERDGAWFDTEVQLMPDSLYFLSQRVVFVFTRAHRGDPLQCSCLGNPMDGGAWQDTVHGVARVRHDLATKAQ